jgi:hypothetical protein
MRSDMPDLFVGNHPAHRRADDRPGRPARDIEELPFSEPMTPRSHYRDGSGGHYTALQRFLRSRQGCPWAQVIGDVARQADPRSYRGYALRRAVEHMVEDRPEWVGRLTVGEVGVDADGVVIVGSVTRKRRRRTKPPTTDITVDGQDYHLFPVKTSAPAPDPFVAVFSPATSWAWYRVTWVPCPTPTSKMVLLPYDDRKREVYEPSVLHCCVRGDLRWSADTSRWISDSGATKTYAVAKQSVSKRDLRRIRAVLRDAR